MSFTFSLKTKLTLQDAMSESWEENYPNKCPFWLNCIGWTFVFALSSSIEY